MKVKVHTGVATGSVMYVRIKPPLIIITPLTQTALWLRTKKSLAPASMDLLMNIIEKCTTKHIYVREPLSYLWELDWCPFVFIIKFCEQLKIK